VDSGVALIAGSPAEAGAALRAESWTCPHCGGTDFDVTCPYRDGDLDDLPIPILALRELRGMLGHVTLPQPELAPEIGHDRSPS
jgi:hypothetical protein